MYTSILTGQMFQIVGWGFTHGDHEGMDKTLEGSLDKAIALG